VISKMYLDAENKTFIFDHSTQAIACDRKLYYKCGLELSKKAKKPALFFGSAMHKFAEAYWSKKSAQECIDAFTKYARQSNSPLDQDPESDEQRSVTRGIEICAHYMRKYEPIRQQTKLLHLGGENLVEVPFVFPLGEDGEGWTYLYCGRIDRVEDQDGLIRLVDTKTTTRFGSTYWNQLRPNDQLTGYAAAYKEMTGKLPDRVVLDVIYIGEPRKPDENGKISVPKKIKALGPEEEALWIVNARFEQGPTKRSQVDIDAWWLNTMTEGMRMRRLFEHLHYPSMWTQRTSQCNAYGECDFRDICSVTSNPQPIINDRYEVKPWSPFIVEEENGAAKTE
jgi:PD-(D/E)XK nuclease superfamily protein